MRRTRQEILELFEACQAKLGRTPGAPAFRNIAGVKNSEVLYYWPSHGALAKEAGGQPNKFKSRLDDNVVFEEYAKVCLHVGKIPSRGEFRIAVRELEDTQTSSVYTRHGSIQAFREKFRAWLPTAREEFKVILGYTGWSDTGSEAALEGADSATAPVGYVYLLKHGSRREYKIGRTNNPLRREGEVGIQLPETLEPVHYIKTDDPVGIENYW